MELIGIGDVGRLDDDSEVAELARLREPPPAELPGRDSASAAPSSRTELARDRDNAASPSSPETLNVPENFRNVPAPSTPPSDAADSADRCNTKAPPPSSVIIEPALVRRDNGRLEGGEGVLNELVLLLLPVTFATTAARTICHLLCADAAGGAPPGCPPLASTGGCCNCCCCSCACACAAVLLRFTDRDRFILSCAFCHHLRRHCSPASMSTAALGAAFAPRTLERT